MSHLEDFTIHETEEHPSKNPFILIAFPDVGLVGTIAAGHMIQTLSMKPLGFIDSDVIPPVVFLHGNKILEPVRI